MIISIFSLGRIVADAWAEAKAFDRSNPLKEPKENRKQMMCHVSMDCTGTCTSTAIDSVYFRFADAATEISTRCESIGYATPKWPKGRSNESKIRHSSLLLLKMILCRTHWAVRSP